MPSVALVCFDYDVIGGLASYTHDLAHALSERQVPTTVFCGTSSRVTEERINAFLTIVRLPALRLPPRGYWFQLLNYSNLATRLNGFDVIHAVNSQSAAICSLIKRDWQRMVTTVHNPPVSAAMRFFSTPLSYWSTSEFLAHLLGIFNGWILSKLCYSRSECIVCVSENTRQKAILTYGRTMARKMTVIPNAVYVKPVETPQADKKADEEFALFYGRITAGKGILLLLRAISILRNQFPKFRLVIIGNGSLTSRMQERSKELGISANVKFRESLPRQELMAIIDKSQFVVIPSFNEGLSFALIESMGRGKAVVALDYDFNRELIEDNETGLLALPNPNDLAQKMQLLAKNVTLRESLGRKARDRVNNDYNLGRTVEQYIKLYQILTTRH